MWDQRWGYKCTTVKTVNLKWIDSEECKEKKGHNQKGGQTKTAK